MSSIISKSVLEHKYGKEQVLVTPFISTYTVPDKYSPFSKETIASLYDNWRFMLRCDAEYNMSVTQIIPYVLVIQENRSSVYVTERMAGEERLSHALSLGAGGHINPVDTQEGFAIVNGAIRELNEELDVKLANDGMLEYAGTVRDITSATGEHLGVVFVAYAKSARVREKNTLKGKWMDFQDLMRNYSKFESWARYIIDYMLLHGKNVDIVNGGKFNGKYH